MASLPDEIWTSALQVGVDAGILDYRDLCSISIASRSLNRLSCFACLWKPLIERDFPPKQCSASGSTATNRSNCKAEYKARFEKIKAAKVAAHKRKLLRLQSECATLEKECKDLETKIQAENLKLSNVTSEIKALEQARISSVALMFWQPERVRIMQQQIVEQQPVDPEFRQFSLEMEAKVCRQEIRTCKRRIDKVAHAIQKATADLEFLTYNPLQVLPDNMQQKSSIKRQKIGKDLLEKQIT